MSNVHIPKYDEEDTLTLKIGYSSKMKTYKKMKVYMNYHTYELCLCTRHRKNTTKFEKVKKSRNNI